MDSETQKFTRIIGWVIGGLVLFTLVISLNPLVVISAGERGIVLNWGAVSNTILNEGLHWRTPFLQKVVKIDTRIQKEQVDASASSKDLQTVNAGVALNFHLQEDKVNTLWQKIGSEYKTKIIDPAIQESVKSVTAKYTAEELITKREQVKDEIKLSLRDRLSQDYISVDDFSIVNFEFSKSFDEAIESKVTAEQNALAAKNKLEQVKYEADQRIAEAQGEAEAIKIQAQAIQNQGGKEYVQLQAINKWNGSLPNYMLGNAVPFINLDTK